MKHSIIDVLLLVLFAKIANIVTWEEVEYFGLHYEKELKKYGAFENGIPFHDTIQRVMAIISPEVTAEMQRKWAQLVNGAKTEKLRKILNIDRPCAAIGAKHKNLCILFLPFRKQTESVWLKFRLKRKAKQ